jgi:hypothetical protein
MAKFSIVCVELGKPHAEAVKASMANGITRRIDPPIFGRHVYVTLLKVKSMASF